jgi:enamine deaminase RidA (YjgF/YER057c/UK114 family)
MFQRVVEGCLRRRVSYLDTSDDIYAFVVHHLDQHAETSQPRGFNMRDSIRQRVQALGLTLPTPSQPIANYINHVISRNPLFISGQIPLLDGKPAYVGRLGESLGDKGRHVRTAVGVFSLPGGVAVEVDAMFELQP